MLAVKLPEIPTPAASPAASVRRHSTAGRPPRSVHGSVAGFKILPRRRCEDYVGNFPSLNDIASAANLHNSSCTTEQPRSRSSCRMERPRSSSGRRPSLQSSTAKQNSSGASNSLQSCFLTMSYTKEAQRKWEEEEARRILVEKIQMATEAIKTYILAAGDSADLADQMLTLMKKEEAVLKAFNGSSVLPEVVDGFRERAYRPLCEAKVRREITFRMTEAQKQEIINRVLDGPSHTELFALLQDQGRRMDLCVNAVMSAVHDKSPTFHCPICMDPLASISSDRRVDTSNMWFAPLRKTEHWSNHPCGHACCRSCMARWTETAINDQKLRIKCPAECCPYSLWDQDVQELVSREVFERHREHKNADYLCHLKESIQENATLNTWLKSNARPCPSCHVIVSRSEGCNVMTCVCGTRFCYACGFQQCKCGTKERGDIWNPESGPERDQK